MICSRKGYPLKVVMPENVTPERTQLLRMYGADIVHSPATRAPTARSRWRWRWPRTTRASICLHQYGNPANPRAHYDGTAPEILEELDGDISAFVAGLGTGGTLMGNGRAASRRSWATRWIVAPSRCRASRSRGLRSLDDGFIPPIIDLSLLDRKIFVTNRDAIVWTRRLLDEEGVFAASPRAPSRRSRCASPTRWTRATSSSSSATTDGSTSPAGSTHAARDEIENLESTVWW